jgi:hypothetical protein
MKMQPKRTAGDWFRAAKEAYVAQHQGCPWCRSQHCVFRSFEGNRVEYFCSICEFSICLETQSRTYHLTLGDAQAVAASVLDVEI